MRRIIPILTLAFLALFTLLAEADLAAPSANTANKLNGLVPVTDAVRARSAPMQGSLETAPGQMVTGRALPVQLEAVPDASAFAPLIDPTDNCSDTNNNLNNATSGFPANVVLSGQTIVNNYTVSTTDPDLFGCLNNSYANTQGYRTAWYSFIAPATGVLKIESLPNFEFTDDYDTVIRLYQGVNCSSLRSISCNDDFIGFLGRIDTTVIQGRKYYVEIADRNLGVNGEAKLNLQILLTAENFWATSADWNKPNAFRSRHSVVVDGDNLYVIAGQTVLDNQLPLAPTRINDLSRFDASTKTWTRLTPMPPICDADGYSNTDAALVNGKIYVPSGYVGDNEIYAGTPCVYDIETDSWSLGTPPPWVNGLATAYSTVVSGRAADYYIVGGLSGEWLAGPGDATASKAVYSYFTASDTWILLPNLPDGRYAHTGTLLLEQFLCVAGGLRPVTPTNTGGVPTELVFSTLCLDILNINNGWQAADDLNVPRFNAGTVIGPNGEWYIIGGLNGSMQPVAEIEVFNPATGSWTVLDRRFNIEEPARSWVRGGFVDDKLYLIGGETNPCVGDPDVFAGYGFCANVIGLVERIELPEAPIPTQIITNTAHLTYTMFAPIMIDGSGTEIVKDDANEPDNTIETANSLYVGQAFQSNFKYTFDRFDMYVFDNEATRNVEFNLTSIPLGEDYDLYVYDYEKRLLGTSSSFINLDESITLNLPYGRYYVLVVAVNNVPTIVDDYFLGVRLP